MDRNFARSLALVLKSEGGWSDNPADPGGATMNGVTLATFRAYIKPGGTKVDLRAITDEQLSACYRRQYWDAVAGDQLPDGVDYAVFDFAVNSGPGRAAKYLQRVVGTTPDGAIGPATIAAASSLPAGAVLDRLCDLRLEFLKHLPTWTTFGKGWASRVASVRKDALLMSYRAPQAAPPAPVAPAPVQPKPVAPAAAPVPPAVVREPQPLPAPVSRNKTAGFAAFFALLIMAAAGFWHHLAAFVSNLF